MAAENKIAAVVVMYDNISQKDLGTVIAFQKKHAKKPVEIFDVKDRLFMFYEDTLSVGKTAEEAYLTAIDKYKNPAAAQPDEKTLVELRAQHEYAMKNLVGTAVMSHGSLNAHFPNEKKGATVIPYVYDICFNHKKKYPLVDKMLSYLKEHVLATIPFHIDHKRINIDVEEKDEMCGILTRNGFEQVDKWTHRTTTKKYISYTWYGERPSKKREDLLLQPPVADAPTIVPTVADAPVVADASAAQESS